MSIAAPETIRIATRESPLALWQARHVKEKLEALYPACRVELLGTPTDPRWQLVALHIG